MKEQVKIFFAALMFYSRIPCPGRIDYAGDKYLHKTIRFLPVVGWIVGLFSGFVFSLFASLNEPVIGLALSMIASIWITGAFHEDGFADVCDGFGGGWNREKILNIMKDSRIGTYGAIGIVLLLSLKFLLLYRLWHITGQTMVTLLFVMINGHSLSRFMAATFIYTHGYVRDDTSSKVKSAGQKISGIELLVVASFGIIPLLLFQCYTVLGTIIPVYLAKWGLGRYFQKWINGYTGDCLGATQQVTEVVFYLSILLLWKFI